MNTQTLPQPKALLSKALLSKAQLSTAQLSKALLPRTAPRAAFGKIVLNEARLAWRLPAGLIFGVAVPLLLLIIFGEIPGMHQPQASMGGLTLFPVYVPILISMAIAILALISLPAALVSYRDQGILRRLSTTPVPPSWLLAAQLVINFCIAMTSLLIVIVVGMVAFGLDVPKNPGALLLSIVLSIAALFAIGLSIAAAARSGIAARAIGAGVFYPLLFFAGMWFPRAAHAGHPPGHQQLHPARGVGGSDAGLDAGPVPARRAPAGAGRVRVGLRLHRQALLPLGMKDRSPAESAWPTLAATPCR